MTEIIFFSATHSNDACVIFDGVTKEVFCNNIHHQHNHNQHIASFAIPRTVYELCFLAQYVQCRLSDSLPTQTWATWEEVISAQSLDLGTLLWIVPPLYYDHLRPSTSGNPKYTFEDAIREFESSPGFIDLRWQLNNNIVAQMVSVGVILEDTTRPRLCVVHALVQQACECLTTCKQHIDDWFQRQDTGSVLLEECDAVLFSLKSRDDFINKDLLYAVAAYEWKVTEQLMQQNERLLYRSSLQQEHDDVSDQRLYWTGEDMGQHLVLRSVSFGASLFAGCIYDSTACVWYLQCQECQRILRVLHSSSEDPAQVACVYYPSMSALTRLCCIGEIHHPRTRCVTNKSLPTSIVAGLHNTSIAALPECLKSPLFHNINTLQDQWSRMCQCWQYCKVDVNILLEPSPSALIVPLLHPGSLSLQQMTWLQKLTACCRAGITLPIISYQNQNETTGFDWLYQRSDIYRTVSDLICNVAGIDRPEMFPANTFLPHAISSNYFDMLSTTNAGELLVFSVLSSLSISNEVRLHLHEAVRTSFGLSVVSIDSGAKEKKEQEESQLERGTRVRLASLNVAGHRTEKKWEQLLSFLQPCNLDVLVLQEVPFKLAQRLSNDLKLPYFAHAPADWLNNAVLSRYPLQHVEQMVLQGEHRKEKRSAVVCDVVVNTSKNSIITVAATHLDHMCENERVIQLKQLESKLASRITASVGTVIAGDLNSVTRTDYDDNQWKENAGKRKRAHLEPPCVDVSEMLSREYVDVATGLKLGHTHALNNMTATSTHGTRVDYILIRQGSKLVPIPSTYCAVETFCSDHRLICCELILTS